MRYEFPLLFNLGMVVPHVGHVIDRVNESMREFGFSEKLGVSGPIASIQFDAEEEIATADLCRIEDAITQFLKEKMPDTFIGIGEIKLIP